MEFEKELDDKNKEFMDGKQAMEYACRNRRALYRSGHGAAATVQTGNRPYRI